MNIIDAICNIVINPAHKIVNNYSNRNRANLAGDALEEYVKDIFADSFGLEESERLEKISRCFSYLGNSSNPPDAMLRDGDAIEVKKIESYNASLALNSSYPKHTLKRTSDMISAKCRDAEKNWTEKDILYIVGVVKGEELKHLCMVYGKDYCASDSCYERVKTIIKTGVEATAGVEFSATHELGRINRIDPLGITYMRVRGMWGIENPWQVFNYIYKRDMSKNFNFMALIADDKFNSFDNTDKLFSLSQKNSNLKISDVRVKDPDNPAVLNNAKLISYYN